MSNQPRRRKNGKSMAECIVIENAREHARADLGTRRLTVRQGGERVADRKQDLKKNRRQENRPIGASNEYARAYKMSENKKNVKTNKKTRRNRETGTRTSEREIYE